MRGVATVFLPPPRNPEFLGNRARNPSQVTGFGPNWAPEQPGPGQQTQHGLQTWSEGATRHTRRKLPTGPLAILLADQPMQAILGNNRFDTDFTVKLTDVYPDGRSMLLTDGILRARFRESFEQESLLQPGKLYELTVDLWSTSIVFAPGHKVCVAVSSSNAPRFDLNPNTGHPFRADDETRIATNTLHVSRQHPSHIIFPIYAGRAK